MSDDASLRNSIVLSANRALLGSITPNLRAVAAYWDDRKIEIVFYFHGSPSAEDEETMSVVHTEVATDFIDICPVDFSIERVDMPLKIPFKTGGLGALVFKRQEPSSLRSS